MTVTVSHDKIRAALTSEPQDFAAIVRKSGVNMALAREILLELQRDGEADLVYGFGWHSTSEDDSHVYQGSDIEETWTELEDGTKYLSIEIHRDEEDIEARFTTDEARDLALSIFKEVGTTKLATESEAPKTKFEKMRSLQELSDIIEKQTRRVLYRIANDSKVDPELSNDLRNAVDEFLAKAEERINRG